MVTARARWGPGACAHLTVTRSPGSAWSIRGKRDWKVSASGTFLSSMVLRTPLRLSGELRMFFRRCMASSV